MNRRVLIWSQCCVDGFIETRAYYARCGRRWPATAVAQGMPHVENMPERRKGMLALEPCGDRTSPPRAWPWTAAFWRVPARAYPCGAVVPGKIQMSHYRCPGSDSSGCNAGPIGMFVICRALAAGMAHWNTPKSGRPWPGSGGDVLSPHGSSGPCPPRAWASYLNRGIPNPCAKSNQSNQDRHSLQNRSWGSTSILQRRPRRAGRRSASATSKLAPACASRRFGALSRSWLR